jgi:adenylate kinase family enzyme
MSIAATPEEKKEFKENFGHPKIVCSIGGPCSGKKEYALYLAEQLGYTYVSTGDILRLEIEKVSPNDLSVNSCG